MGKKKSKGGDVTRGMSEKDRKRLFAGIKEIVKKCRVIGDKKFDLQKATKACKLCEQPAKRFKS